MDLASDHDSTERLDHKYSDPPIGYINVRQPRARSLRPAVDVDQSDDEEGSMSRDHAPETTQHAQDGHQTDGALLSQIQSRIQTLLPLLTSTSRAERFTPTDPDPLAYLPPNRDNNARFARAPSSAGHIRHRGGAPAMSAHDVPRGAPQRRDSIMTASESSILSATSPSVGFDQRQQSVQSDTQRSEMPYRRPGKHRVGESPTPEEYMALPPEAKKKVDNRLSARRSRAKRKEHVHVLTTQITEQQQVIEMLRIENKQLNDHIANLSRAGYSLHPPPFPPSLVPHPSHLRHAPPPPPSHIHPRHLPPVSHPNLPPPIPSGSPRRSLLVASPGLSTHPSLASSSGLVAAAAPPTGPGQVPILTHHTRSEAGSSYAGQGQGSIRYESPGRGTKREVEDERDDRLRSRMRYASPDRSNWERDPEGRRLSHSAYRSPPAGHSQRKIRDHSRSPSPSPLRPQWGDLPPSLAAPQHLSGRRRSDYDPSEEVGDEQDPIEISGQGTVSDRLATLIRVHKRAITTYQATRRAQLSRREERMEGLLGAAEAIGKEVEEVTEEFRFVSQDGD